jgi:hypothetical protein
MAQEQTSRNSGLQAWSAVLLRLTAFPAPSAEFAQQNWWFEVVGDQPAKRQEEPRKALRREDGPFAKANLTLISQPQRIDWIYKSTEEYEPIGQFTETLDQFIPAMKRWLESTPPILRLAFGATMVIPTENRESGYRILSPFLRNVQIDPKNSSDLVYQINRPRPAKTKISGLSLNRLCKWSVIQLNETQITVDSVGRSVANLPSKVSYFCELTLDLSTAAEFQAEIPNGQLTKLLDELVALGQETAREGDIP